MWHLASRPRFDRRLIIPDEFPRDKRRERGIYFVHRPSLSLSFSSVRREREFAAWDIISSKSRARPFNSSDRRINARRLSDDSDRSDNWKDELLLKPLLTILSCARASRRCNFLFSVSYKAHFFVLRKDSRGRATTRDRSLAKIADCMYK